MSYFGTVSSLLQSVDSHGSVQLKPIKKKNSCYVLATVQLIPRVVDFLVYFFTYAPKTLGLDNSSCVPDEYTDFDVIQTPPNNARGTMHYTSCWAFIYQVSFEELVKCKKYLVLRVCPTLVQ